MAMPMAAEPLHIQILVSEMVKPSSPPPYPTPLLHSCKLDHVIANIYVKTVHFFRQQHGVFCDNIILKRSLAEALSIYYPLAGTITSAYDIICNGNGSLFIEAVSDMNLSDLGNLVPHPRLLRLIPALDLSLEVTLRPLLLIQVTRFKCGGVSVGLAVEHHVADGASALLFLKAWSKIARGETISVIPSFDKAWLRPTSCVPIKSLLQHEEYLLLPKPPSELEPNDCFANDSESDKEIVAEKIDLSSDLLEKLRAEGGWSLTMYEMVAAHVWKCCCEARGLDDAEESMMIMVVDGRARLRGDHHNFIGNAIFNCCLSRRVAYIRSMSLAELGGSIAMALRSVDDEHCRSAISFLEGCNEEQLRSFVKGAHTFRSPNIGLISWTKLPFSEVDFRSGGGYSVLPAAMPWEGHAYLLPSHEEHSGRALSVCIALQRRHMSTFARLVNVVST